MKHLTTPKMKVVPTVAERKKVGTADLKPEKKKRTVEKVDLKAEKNQVNLTTLMTSQKMKRIVVVTQRMMKTLSALCHLLKMKPLIQRKARHQQVKATQIRWMIITSILLSRGSMLNVSAPTLEEAKRILLNNLVISIL